MSQEKIIGYTRISSDSQCNLRQVKALVAYGVDERDIYSDIKSGKNFDRVEYQNMKKHLRKGDKVVFKELDRMGRNMDMIKEEFTWFINNGIDIVILDMPILNTEDKKDLDKKFMTELILTLFSYISEKERMKILLRQKEGIFLAKAKGVYKGRQRIDTSDFAEIYIDWKAKKMTAIQASKELRISPQTFYRRVKETEIQNK
ncbi:recombinase family protein [Clostridium tagluense]|uniref:recombinase family protein n=1 Tax=Clostridium tagluense TaxID=360422 RepID=UPI001C0E1D34|nr:recombinase family protein [Clostridium tagluense]MBU3129078.1 recombinase family protein [Clostridium tagluense]